MGWLEFVVGIAQQLPKHIAKTVHRADRQPIRRARQGRQGMISAKDVTRAVNQENMVALFYRTVKKIFRIVFRGAHGGAL